MWMIKGIRSQKCLAQCVIFASLLEILFITFAWPSLYFWSPLFTHCRGCCSGSPVESSPESVGEELFKLTKLKPTYTLRLIAVIRVDQVILDEWNFKEALKELWKYVFVHFIVSKFHLWICYNNNNNVEVILGLWGNEWLTVSPLHMKLSHKIAFTGQGDFLYKWSKSEAWLLRCNI